MNFVGGEQGDYGPEAGDQPDLSPHPDPAGQEGEGAHLHAHWGARYAAQTGVLYEGRRLQRWKNA